MRPEQVLTQKVAEYSTLYLDMDAFFASVEQFHNPRLRGKPIGVASGPSGGASVLAASYEAKAYGIKTGTRLRDAYAVCPGFEIVNGNHDSYRQVHREFMSILHSTIGQVQAKGIDEAYVKIPTYAQNREDVFTFAQAIKEQLYKKYNEHICCSIGISANIWLAKMAASSEKPNGLTVLDNLNRVEFYKKTTVGDMTGIGRRLTPKLHRLGFCTIYDLYRLDYVRFRRMMGVAGEYWYMRLRGYEVDKHKYKPNKSIGHQVTTEPDRPDTIAKITTVLVCICETLGKRLRAKGLKAQTMQIYVLFDDGTGWGQQMRRLKLFDDNITIMKNAKLLLKKLKYMRPCVKVSITLGGLTDRGQLAFNFFNESDSGARLSRAIDMIQQRYGSHAIMSLRTFTANSVDLNRVGFAGDVVRETSIDPTIKPFNW